MAGPQDIQRYPRGLIDLLGMRATGETPHELARQTAPVLDLWDLYLADRCELYSVPTAAATTVVGGQAFPLAQVPDREVWFLYEASLRVPATAAATLLQQNLCIFRQNGLVTLPLALTGTMRVPALEGGLVGVHFNKPLMMLPGNALGVWTSAITGAPAVNPILTMWFAKLFS
jgi:hypothetical protein